MLIATVTSSGQVANLLYDSQELFFDGYLEPLNQPELMQQLIDALGVQVSVLPVQVDVLEALSKYKNINVEYKNVIPEFADQSEVLI